MRTFCTLILIMLLAFPLLGQNPENSPDTLLQEFFEDTIDPALDMLAQPTGQDISWVNYDQDKKPGSCALGITPKAWYWERDLGFNDTSLSDNDAFTSCSFLVDTNSHNRNWLITSPVYIPDNTYTLCWRSLTYYGPDFMDGYHVLASTTSNLPGSFTDTLFGAAQTIYRTVLGSLNVNDYIMSPGYIHANSYTNTEYFFSDFEPMGEFYHGKLEPHSVSLADYAGQTVYIAFLHDSKDDYQLQIDDILVSNKILAASDPYSFVYFNIFPNPVREIGYVNWKTQAPEAGRLSVADQTGKIVFEKKFNACSEGEIKLEAQGLAPGVYFCKLQTARGHATKLLVKI